MSITIGSYVQSKLITNSNHREVRGFHFIDLCTKYLASRNRETNSVGVFDVSAKSCLVKRLHIV